MITTAHHRYQHPTTRHRWAARGTALLGASALLVTLGLGTESAAEATPSSVAATALGDTIASVPSARKTGNVKGQIESDKAVPAPRAKIVVHTGDGRNFVASFNSNSQGKYSLKGLKPGRYRISITPGSKSPSLLSRVTTFSVTAGKTTVRNVKLTTGARVTGTVTGPNGRPVANVYVSVTRVGNDSGTRTDSKGRYRLEGLRTGTAVVSANGGSAFWNSTARVKVKVGSMAVHNATLKKSGSVTGTVMDQETGAPVPGVKVFLNSYTETTTDAQGKYSFTGIQYRTNTVNTSLTGLDPVPNLLTNHVETVIVGSGRRTVADFFLPRGAVVEGLITDSSGQPFDSGSVSISIWGYEEEIGDEGGWDFEDARGTANDDGTFRFERLGWSSVRAEVRLQYCPARDGATQCAKLATIPVQYRPGRITDLGRVAIDPTFSQVATTKVEGAAVVGQTLRAMPSTWHPTPVTRKYQWFRNGVAVEGATSRNYTLTSADRGARMSVEYTGSSPRFVTASSLSAQTPKVAAAS